MILFSVYSPAAHSITEAKMKKIIKNISTFYERNYIILMLILIVLAISIMPIDGKLVASNSVYAQLNTTYTNVAITDKQINFLFLLHGCSRDDSAAYQFTAINKDQQPVLGTACVRAFFHTVSIRTR
jgi:hypothetical protein